MDLEPPRDLGTFPCITFLIHQKEMVIILISQS
jgi:hypothetical protein